MFSKTLDFVCWFLLAIFLRPSPTELEKIRMSGLKPDEWPPKDEYDPAKKKALWPFSKFKVIIPSILIIKVVSYVLSIYGL